MFYKPNGRFCQIYYLGVVVVVLVGSVFLEDFFEEDFASFLLSFSFFFSAEVVLFGVVCFAVFVVVVPVEVDGLVCPNVNPALSIKMQAE
jgi:hypothetical protein